jgi:Cu-Zn family superoxide dismutase
MISAESLLLVVAAYVAMCHAQIGEVKFAICRMSSTSGKDPIEGTIYLQQQLGSYGNGTSAGTKIDVYLKKFSTPGQKGFHVHDSGDLGNACLLAGAHYNPFNKSHGAPTDTERHVGDLGNIDVSIDGTVSKTIYDSQITLVGPYSVIGRAFVVHQDPDDLGKGTFNDSKTTGHAGARLGCCKIESSTAADNIQGGNPSSMAPTSHSVSYCVLCMAALISIFHLLLKSF